MNIVAVDIGGTFTDFIGFDGDGIRTLKLPSTPEDPAAAMLAGLRELGVLAGSTPVVHGSTVGTNAILERKGARLALLTTAGFEDLLEIGRQARPHLYDLRQVKPPALAPRERCFGVPERMAVDGTVIEELTADGVADIMRRIKTASPEAIAVCLLSAFASPAHERRLREALAVLGVPVVLSSDISPEYREYERASTTALSAYIQPVMARYLDALESNLGKARLRIMQSNGGAISTDVVKRETVRTILSGPAGGAAGVCAVARDLGETRVIGFDMGGTSTDVTLVDGSPRLTLESGIAGMPVRTPMLDIHTVGAGGGSIARLDAGGALRVGPESAGATPGPACYGKGELPTVTDANVILGRIDPALFLGGKMALAPERARQAMDALAKSANVSVEAAAEGVIDVVNVSMRRAIQVISVERGHDPALFSLLAFGGAGGLHACDLAESVGMRRVIWPRFAGLLSAYGMAVADIVKEYAHQAMQPLTVFTANGPSLVSELERRARSEMAGEAGILALSLECSLDTRYAGQSYELPVPYAAEAWAVASAFHAAHERQYGYADAAREMEIVTVRLRAIGRTAKPDLPMLAEGAPGVPIGMRRLRYRGSEIAVAAWRRGDLRAGQTIAGPAVIYDESSTLLVTPAFRATVHTLGHVILERA